MVIITGVFVTGVGVRTSGRGVIFAEVVRPSGCAGAVVYKIVFLVVAGISAGITLIFAGEVFGWCFGNRVAGFLRTFGIFGKWAVSRAGARGVVFNIAAVAGGYTFVAGECVITVLNVAIVALLGIATGRMETAAVYIFRRAGASFVGGGAFFFGFVILLFVVTDIFACIALFGAGEVSGRRGNGGFAGRSIRAFGIFFLRTGFAISRNVTGGVAVFFAYIGRVFGFAGVFILVMLLFGQTGINTTVALFGAGIVVGGLFLKAGAVYFLAAAF